jgi:hypothetical protein
VDARPETAHTGFAYHAGARQAPGRRRADLTRRGRDPLGSRDLALSTGHDYAEPGEYTVVIKVIDILGNDTTKTLSVKVAGRGSA